MISPLQLPKLEQVQINDKLWSRYTDMVADVIVPYQWKILNDRIPGANPAYNNWKILDSQADNFIQDGGQQVMESYCIKNFCIAAGEIKGEHKGVIFVDTDVYKWLETVAYCLHNGSCKDFENIADEVISLIGRAQQPDGYLNTYYTVAEPQGRWSNLVEGHELYCAGYLIEAGVAYYEATGKGHLLNSARRFADLICREFGPGEGQRKGYPGHQEIELALVKLYRCTGQHRYLDCARFFIDERGQQPNYFSQEIEDRDGQVIFPEFREYELKYSQAHMPPRQQRTAEGHAVRATYMYCAMADIAREDGDEELLDTCRALWNNITQRRMYITGGIGSSGFFERFTTDYDLPNDASYCETCASIGLALFGRRMSLIERDAAYFDIVERALYNTVLAGISLSGDRYFYVNPLEVWPDNCLTATSMKHVKAQRQRWFSVACCPPNVARTLASLGHYIYAHDDNTIYVNLFISSSFKAKFAGAEAELTMLSGLMQDGDIAFDLTVQPGADIRLAIRIPDYAQSPEFLLDGIPLTPVVDKSYAIICGGLSGQHTVTMRLNVKPQWMAADPLLREDAGKVALLKGPCVYCLEEADNGANLSAVLVEADAAVREEEGHELPGALPTLCYEGLRITRKCWNGDELYSEAHFNTEAVSLKAVPYCLWGNRQPGEMLVWHKCRI
jgi:hypothetical protein